MQAQMSKKEKSPVVFCPRCHAQNLASQSRCGKCGYVFPAKGAYKGEKKGQMPGMPPPMVPVSTPMPGSGGMAGEMGGVEGQPGAEAEEPPKLTRPKHIPEKGVSEGPMASHGKWLSCPRCGADIKPDAKRCVRCGYRPG